MVLAGEEGTNCERVLRQDHRVDGSQSRVLERSHELRTVQVVQTDGSIETTRSEQAHVIVDEYA